MVWLSNSAKQNDRKTGSPKMSSGNTMDQKTDAFSVLNQEETGIHHERKRENRRDGESQSQGQRNALLSSASSICKRSSPT